MSGGSAADTTAARTPLDAPASRSRVASPPRLGFLGLGWIGRARMQAALEAGVAAVVALADPADDALAGAAALAPDARRGRTLDDLLAARPDGIVVATPSALHARDARRALEAGVAVFCQKPLGRDEDECRSVVEAARAADRLLGVDLCYRHTHAAQALHALLRSGGLGHVYALDLTFHNAYGPDKPWFYRRRESGGGCLLDLGTHLIDLAMWLLGEERVAGVDGTLLYRGRPLHLEADPDVVEDYATAELAFPSGARVRLACSWGLPAGRDAVIDARLWGTEGGARLRNVRGSYYDFVAERYRGTAREVLVEPPDGWGGRTLASWCRALSRSSSYDPTIESVVEVARVLDALYRRPNGGPEGAAPSTGRTRS